MAEFQEQQMFQGATQSQGFAPLQAPDTSRFLRENMGVIDANFGRLQAQQEAELNRKLKQQQDLLATLGQFSETAMNFAQTQGKAFIDAEILKGHTKARSLGKAFNYGIKPEIQQQFDAVEKEAKVDSAKFAGVAEEMGKQGAPMEAVNYIKSLSAYQQIGATRAYLQNKGNTYQDFVAKFLQRTDIKLPRPGGGEFVPRDAHQDGALMNIALSAASEMFDAQEVGIGSDFSPSGIAMKGLYEKKDEVEAAFVNNANRTKNINDSSDRVDRAINLWTSNRDLNALLSEVRGTYDERGNIRDRTAALDLIFEEVLVNAYAAGDTSVAELLTQPVLDENGNPTGQTWGQRFKNRIEGEGGLNSKFETIDRRNRARRDEEFQEKVKEEKERLQQAIVSARQNREEVNEATIKQFRKLSAERLGIPEESPELDFYKDYLTKESKEDQQDIDRLNALRNPLTGRGFLLESDFVGTSQAVQDAMFKYVEEDKTIAQRPKSFVSDNEKLINALTSEYFKLEQGDAPKTPEWENMARRAREAEARYYIEYIRTGSTPQEAQALTRKRLEQNFKANTYTVDPKITPDIKYKRTLSSARTVMSQNPGSVDKAVFAGTDNELKQLDRYNQGLTNDLPKLYYDLAVGNKKLSAWDIASAQYRAYTGKPLRTGPAKQSIQSKSKAYQSFMNYRPTVKRGARADTTSFKSQTSSLPNPTLKRAADIVSNYESAGAGGYNAVNQGGEAGGTAIPAGFYSGDFRNMPQHGGRALTSLTVGEIMDLQADPGKSKMSNADWVKKGKLHAVGRYQFIGPTLRGLVQRLGISRDAKFTPQLQDRLFLSLLKSGGPGQWVGLRNATAAEMAIINQARSQL